MRVLGIDFGTKKIGLAISDESGKFAFPRSVINLWKFNFNRFCKENDVGKIILGRPLGYKGDAAKILKEIEKFKDLLEKETGLEVVYENEVLTTQQVMRSFNYRGSTSLVEKVDAAAAAIILQSYLDRENNMIE